MGKYGSDQVGFFLVDGYDMLGAITALEGPTVEAVMERSDPLGASWQEQTPTGAMRATMTQSGFYDDVANGSHVALNEQQDVSRVFCLNVDGNAAGQTFDGAAGTFGMKYGRKPARDALIKADAEYRISGQVDRDGIILQPRATKTADWNTESASYDAAASSDAGGAGYLQVSELALDGHDSLDVTIRHSADDSTFADLIAFTAVTAEFAGERIEVSGTVNRYLAVDGDFAGTGTAPTAKVFVGFKRFPEAA
ncbi:MAG: hypothetical protein AB7O67_16550 [Vicinamibacterales bacterium]